MKFELKAFRGSSTFTQVFTNEDAFIDKRTWLITNGFTIGTIEDHTRACALPSFSKVMAH